MVSDILELEVISKMKELYDLVSLEPEGDKTYKCMNCREFDIETDVCNTEFAREYCFRQQDNRCPGYNPPENGRFVFVVSGPINLEAQTGEN